MLAKVANGPTGYGWAELLPSPPLSLQSVSGGLPDTHHPALGFAIPHSLEREARGVVTLEEVSTQKSPIRCRCRRSSDKRAGRCSQNQNLLEGFRACQLLPQPHTCKSEISLKSDFSPSVIMFWAIHRSFKVIAHFFWC